MAVLFSEGFTPRVLRKPVHQTPQLLVERLIAFSRAVPQGSQVTWTHPLGFTMSASTEWHLFQHTDHRTMADHGGQVRTLYNARDMNNMVRSLGHNGCVPT